MKNYNIDNYNKYRRALQEKGIIVFPVKGTTVDSYNLGKTPYTNNEYKRFNSFYSFKERPFTEEEMEFYFNNEKGEIGLGVVFGELENREGIYLVGLDVDEMIEGSLEDFENYCIDSGLAVTRSASKGIHVYGYSEQPYPDTGVTIEIGGFKVRGDLWGNGGKYFVAPPTKVNNDGEVLEYTATDSFMGALFAGDFSQYPKTFIEAFNAGSSNTLKKVEEITKVKVSSVDVDGFVEAYSHVQIDRKSGENLGRHEHMVAIAKTIFKRVYDKTEKDESISLVIDVLIKLRDKGIFVDGHEKTDKEIQDVSRYCYSYRDEWEKSIKTPEFQKTMEDYRVSGKLPNNLDDFRKKYIVEKCKTEGSEFDVEAHKKNVARIKELNKSLLTLEGKALKEAEKEIRMLRAFVNAEVHSRLLHDLPNLKYLEEGDRFYDYDETKGVYFDYQPEMFLSKAMNMLVSYELPAYNSRARAKDVLCRIIKHTPSFKVNTNPNLVCVGNGILNLKKGVLTPYRADFVSLTKVETDFVPQAGVDGEFFGKFIKQITLEDKDQASLLQEFSGYSLTPSTHLQTALIMLGEGSNGKGVFAHVLTKLIGREHTSFFKADELNKRFGVAYLQNKRLNVCDEVSGNFLDSHVIKSLISGDIQTSDVKNRDQITFKPETKLLFTVNDLPAINDTSFGLYRRFIITEMKGTFTKELGNIDFEIQKKIETEMSVVLNWALAGYHRLLENDQFTENADNAELMEEYRFDNVPVERFILNGFMEDTGGAVTLREAHKQYVSYMQIIGKKPKSINYFARDLKRSSKHGELFTYEPRQHGKDTAKICGIKINPNLLSDDDFGGL